MLKNHDKKKQSPDLTDPTDPDINISAPEQDQTQNQMWSNPRVRGLVMLIITMFIILMAGIGVLIYKISQKALTKETADQGQGAQIPTLSLGNAQTEQNAAISSKANTMQLEMNGYTIEKMSTTGKFLTLYVKKNTIEEIWVIDTGGNKLYKTIKLK